MTEYVPLEHVPEVAAAAFNVSEELKKAIEAANSTIEARSFSERHPELGKMINCQVCRRRHRATNVAYKKKGKVVALHNKCEQVFTNRVGDYELFREDAKGELVPDYRTAIHPDSRPTSKQVMGRASVAKKRFHPHPSKIKLLFVERVREVFVNLGFDIDEKDKEVFSKNLQRARVVAARQLRKEYSLSSRRVRIMQDTSRRINREA